MKKIDKAHRLWANYDESQKNITTRQALKLLSMVCEAGLFSGMAECGERVNVIQKGGAIIRGYVTYASELGGYIVYANHNVGQLNETNTIPIDVENVVSIEYIRGKQKLNPFE